MEVLLSMGPTPSSFVYQQTPGIYRISAVRFWSSVTSWLYTLLFSTITFFFCIFFPTKPYTSICSLVSTSTSTVVIYFLVLTTSVPMLAIVLHIGAISIAYFLVIERVLVLAIVLHIGVVTADCVCIVLGPLRQVKLLSSAFF